MSEPAIRHYSNIDKHGLWLCGDRMPADVIRRGYPLPPQGPVTDCTGCVEEMRKRRRGA